jgi:hypothetical protein
MPGPYIDFISAYCDRWCERCAFTGRCSNFAVASALAMCDGNFEAAIELAIGPPRVPGGKPQQPLHERMAEALEGFEPTEKELEEIGREMEARRERIEKLAVAEASQDYAIAVHRWLQKHSEASGATDAGVQEALEVVDWDQVLIHVKIMRALDGRDECPDGDFRNEGPIHSDWNGSAKVATISIDRSARAWRVIAAATGDEAAGVLAASLATLSQQMSREFPHAMEFRRPGFDEAEQGGEGR